ncbi:MAG TPA: hypothetical protein RWO09_00425 [Ruminococcus sp.]
MRITELIQYSRHLLKGRRARTTMICIMPAAASVFFRTAEACIYSLLLYFGDMKPIELFSGRNRIQLAIAVFFSIMRWTVCAPLIYGTAHRISEISGEKSPPYSRFSNILLSRRCYKRSIAAQLWIKLFSLAALVPVVFFGMTAYSLFTSGHSAGELFMTAHAIVLTTVSVVMWLMLKFSLAAVPLFLVKFPKMSVFRVVIGSLKFMKGRRAVLLRLIAVYTPLILSVAAIPFILPDILTAYSLSIDIYIKEEEYIEGNNAFGRFGKRTAASELSSRSERRFKTASDKA